MGSYTTPFHSEEGHLPVLLTETLLGRSDPVPTCIQKGLHVKEYSTVPLCWSERRGITGLFVAQLCRTFQVKDMFIIEHQGWKPKCRETVSWQPVPSGHRPLGLIRMPYHTGLLVQGVWQLLYEVLTVLAN